MRPPVRFFCLFKYYGSTVAPYLFLYGTEAQATHYLPEMTSGETISCIAMTEASGGSDLQAIRSRAVRDGTYLVL